MRAPVPRSPTPAPPRAVILLAEDDPEVRASLERLLREGGHEVLSAPDGESAHAVSRAHVGPIDILITDVVMSGLGGGELARRLGSERPQTRVLFISGYHPDGTLPLGEDPTQWSEYLQKPVSFGALQRKIATLLAAGTALAAPESDRAT
jgi:CheY-like chemotaxis protein